MNIAQYRSRFGTNLPAASASRRKAISKAGKRYFADPRKRFARRAKKRSELSNWDLSRRFSAGRPNSEIAREFHVKISTIEKRAQHLGFPGTNCPHYFGQLFDSEFARYLKRQSGLSAGELETAIDAKKGALTPLLYPHGGRQRNTPGLVADLIAWLDKTLPALLKTDFRGKPGALPGHKSALISALIPDFHSKFVLLVRILNHLRKFLFDNPDASIEELKKYACEEAWVEVSQGSRKKTFVPLLRWSWQLDELITREWKRLRGTERLELVVCDWLAFRWGTGRGIIFTALRRRNAHIAPRDTANLIRIFGTPPQPAPAAVKPQKKGRGGPRGMREESREKAQALLSAMKRYTERTGKTYGAVKAAAREVYPGQEIYSATAKARWHLRRYRQQSSKG